MTNILNSVINPYNEYICLCPVERSLPVCLSVAVTALRMGYTFQQFGPTLGILLCCKGCTDVAYIAKCGLYVKAAHSPLLMVYTGQARDYGVHVPAKIMMLWTLGSSANILRQLEKHVSNTETHARH